jgi:hypothetical protein
LNGPGNHDAVEKMGKPVGGGVAAGQAAVALEFFEIFARLHMGAVNEGHDNIVHPGFHLNGNL